MPPAATAAALSSIPALTTSGGTVPSRTTPAPKLTKQWQRESARSYGLGLAPALVVLGGITLLPLLTLITVSLTPLSLTNPEGTFHFNQPLGNYAQLLEDERCVHSLWVQF